MLLKEASIVAIITLLLRIIIVVFLFLPSRLLLRQRLHLAAQQETEDADITGKTRGYNQPTIGRNRS